jgi:class 3 adenylate cyclase
VVAPPSGTVTFLFTDIEGSSRMWEESPATMRAALASHDDILRSVIGAHGAMSSRRWEMPSAPRFPPLLRPWM